MNEPAYLTREQAAQYAGVSLDTVRRAINKGTLRAKRLGETDDGTPTGQYRLKREWIDEWFDGLADA